MSTRRRRCRRRRVPLVHQIMDRVMSHKVVQFYVLFLGRSAAPGLVDVIVIHAKRAMEQQINIYPIYIFQRVQFN